MVRFAFKLFFSLVDGDWSYSNQLKIIQMSGFQAGPARYQTACKVARGNVPGWTFLPTVATVICGIRRRFLAACKPFIYLFIF